ncbi:MAG TPA: hypothetical protein VNU97_07615 [Rhizomicrobium sp.]|jgi:hypothetical protein|nr:hypothetical protein [Rhizomicrobium sp.]
MLQRGFSAIVLALTCISIEACQVVGPASIQHGRLNYNDVIARTSNEQVLANIVRVHEHEPTLFIDVTEVDAQVSFQSNVAANGGLNGSRGTTGTATTATSNTTSGVATDTESGTTTNTLSGTTTNTTTGMTAVAPTGTTDTTTASTSTATTSGISVANTLGTSVANTTGTMSSVTNAIASAVTNAFSSNGSGSLTYSESPTIRYAPLLGQPLVQQLQSPISVDSIANLFQSNSRWPALLQLTVDRLAPSYEAYGAALNALIQLDNFNALVVAAYPTSDLISKGGGNNSTPKPVVANPNGTVNVYVESAGSNQSTGGQQSSRSSSNSSLPNDTLMLFLQPDAPDIGPHDSTQSGTIISETRRRILHLWIRLLRIYENTQLEAQLSCTDPNPTIKPVTPDGCLDDLDQRVQHMTDADLTAAFSELPNSIELRTVPLSPALLTAQSVRSAAPVLRTRSAMGVLQTAVATEQSSAIRFFSNFDDFKKAIDTRWNHCAGERAYYVDYDDKFFHDDDTKPCTSQIKSIDATAQDGHLDTSNFESLRNELMYSVGRFFICVIKGRPPAGMPPFVSFEDGGGQLYYIAGDDEVSKQNFVLLSQLLIMQAVVSQTPPLTPTISVN